MKNAFNYSVLPLMLLFFSCSTDADEDTLLDESEFLYGNYVLTELSNSQSSDFNGDGSFSSNLIDELDCLVVSLTLNPDRSTSTEGPEMSILADINTVGFYVYSCMDEMITNSGTWSVNGSELSLGSAVYTIEGNSLIFNNEGTQAPEFNRVVYTKREAVVTVN